MKKYVFSLMTLVTLGTGTMFGETTMEVQSVTTQGQEVEQSTGNHIQSTEQECEEKVRHSRSNKRGEGMTIKKKEVTYSVQTLHM